MTAREGRLENATIKEEYFTREGKGEERRSHGEKKDRSSQNLIGGMRRELVRGGKKGGSPQVQTLITLPLEESVRKA